MNFQDPERFRNFKVPGWDQWEVGKFLGYRVRMAYNGPKGFIDGA